MEIIGQKKLLKQLANFNIDTFPHTALFLGEKGCGKHLIVSYVAKDVLNLPLIDCTEYIDEEYIDQITRTSSPAMYLIDTSKLTEVKQNILLKFAEEPLKNAFVILLAESTNMLLDTIINRCIIFEFETYKKEELYNFLPDSSNRELITDLLRTPGRILTTNISNLLAMKGVCEKMIDKIDKANFSNALTIADKINYSDEFDKFDLTTFLDLLSTLLLSSYMSTNNDKFFTLYNLTSGVRKKLLDTRLNKQITIHNFLTQFWKISKQ